MPHFPRCERTQHKIIMAESGSQPPLDRSQHQRAKAQTGPTRPAQSRHPRASRDAAIAARIADLRRYRSVSECPDEVTALQTKQSLTYQSSTAALICFRGSENDQKPEGVLRLSPLIANFYSQPIWCAFLIYLC